MRAQGRLFQSGVPGDLVVVQAFGQGECHDEAVGVGEPLHRGQDAGCRCLCGNLGFVGRTGICFAGVFFQEERFATVLPQPVNGGPDTRAGQPGRNLCVLHRPPRHGHVLEDRVLHDLLGILYIEENPVAHVEEPPAVWARKILNDLMLRDYEEAAEGEEVTLPIGDREASSEPVIEMIRKAGFDVRTQAQRLQSFYLTGKF